MTEKALSPKKTSFESFSKYSVMRLRQQLLQEIDQKHANTDNFLPFIKERDAIGRLITQDQPKKECKTLHTELTATSLASKFKSGRHRLIDNRVRCILDTVPNSSCRFIYDSQITHQAKLSFSYTYKAVFNSSFFSI